MNNTTYLPWTPYPATKCIGSIHILAALEIASLIPSFLVNTVLLYVLFLNTDNQYASQNIFAKSLTVADVLISGVCQPLFVVTLFLIADTTSEIAVTIQRATFFLTSLACALSMTSLMLVCIQRYIQIVFPFKYELIFSPMRLRVTNIVLWVSSILSTAVFWLKGMDQTVFYEFVLTAISLNLVAFVFIYLHTIYVIKRLIQPTGYNDNSITPNSLKKATKTNAISITLFAALWIPFTVLGFSFFSQNRARVWVPLTGTYTCDRTTRVHATMFLYSILLAHLHSLLNPVVYTLRNSALKVAVANLTKRSFNIRKMRRVRATVTRIIRLEVVNSEREKTESGNFHSSNTKA